jgi:hypothetical protein
MRYMIGDAGNVNRLYWAVKTASEIQAEHLETLSDFYLRKFGNLTNQGKRKRGLKKPRSLEPHFSLARELDLLEWRERERWRITFGPGKTFIALWEKESKQPPCTLLMGQLVRYDRSFLVPLILGLVESDYDFSRRAFTGLEKIARDAWEEVWAEGRRELELKEPPFPDPRTVARRTLLHHAQARVRFLNSNEGLGLNIDKLRRLAELFLEFQFKPLPDDYCFRIGEALTGGRPTSVQNDDLDQLIVRGFSMLKRMGYASGYGIFLFINELILPKRALDWQVFFSYVRRQKHMSTSTSFRSDDFLLTVEKEAIAPLGDT